MGCIMPVGGAPLAMGWGREGGADETSGGDTPTGRGGRGSGGTPERGAVMEAMGGMPGEHIYSTDMIIRHVLFFFHTQSLSKATRAIRERHQRELPSVYSPELDIILIYILINESHCAS